MSVLGIKPRSLEEQSVLLTAEPSELILFIYFCLILTTCIYLFVCLYGGLACILFCIHVEIRGQLVAVGSLFLLCGSWGLN